MMLVWYVQFFTMVILLFLDTHHHNLLLFALVAFRGRSKNSRLLLVGSITVWSAHLRESCTMDSSKSLDEIGRPSVAELQEAEKVQKNSKQPKPPPPTLETLTVCDDSTMQAPTSSSRATAAEHSILRSSSHQEQKNTSTSKEEETKFEIATDDMIKIDMAQAEEKMGVPSRVSPVLVSSTADTPTVNRDKVGTAPPAAHSSAALVSPLGVDRSHVDLVSDIQPLPGLTRAVRSVVGAVAVGGTEDFDTYSERQLREEPWDTSEGEF